jgi:carboxypeptidase Q
MRCILQRTVIVAALLAAAPPAQAQTFPTGDPVLRQIWAEAMDNSQLEPLAQALLDSLGPRLTGTPSHKAANDWLVATYGRWGITARNEQYGTWRGWRRGTSHVDLIAPRVRSLEAMTLAWTGGTRGAVEGAAIVLPDFASPAAFRAWLPQVRGRFVLISYPQPTCRPDDNWREFATPETFSAMVRARAEGREAWERRIDATGHSARTLPAALEQAGAAGIMTSNWSAGWGVNKIFDARTERIPTFDIGCEDYGLVFRLAERNQGPVLRVQADAEFLGEVPVFNTIAEIRGADLPDEYVMLSAHFDSWDGASGATDNGSGTVLMMEAMRILRVVYPNPRRTILVGHWSGEEQGLNGSRAFTEDHPQVVSGLQALFNQDNGTGRVIAISAEGFLGAGAHLADWLSAVPPEITRHIRLNVPGAPSSGGTDHASFVCHGAPAFSLRALDWSYGTYTWHTNRDTFDKLVFDEIRNNAALTAMLVYLASEDPVRVPRERAVATAAAGPRARAQQTGWPECRPAARGYGLTGR